jgi:hypothetical protein
MHPDLRRLRISCELRRNKAALCHIRAGEAADAGDWWKARSEARAGLKEIAGLHGERAERLRALLKRDEQRAAEQLGPYADGPARDGATPGAAP